MIDDPKIATAYAIEAVRVFDHLQFRDRMRGAFGAQRQRLAKAAAPKRITLQKPTVISGADGAWRDRFYRPDTQAFRDRVRVLQVGARAGKPLPMWSSQNSGSIGAQPDSATRC